MDPFVARLIQKGIVKVVYRTEVDPKTGLETVVRRLQFPVGLAVAKQG